MELTIIKERCLALEATEIITRYINKEDYQDTKSKMLNRYGAQFKNGEKEKFLERIGLVSKAGEAVCENLTESAEMEYLFRKHYYGNTHSTLAGIIILNFGDFLKTDIDDYLNSCQERWNHLMEQNLCLKGVAYSALSLENGDRPLKDGLLDDLDKLPYPFEFKWKLYTVLTNFSFYLEQLRDILKSIELSLKEALLTLEPIVEEMQSFWETHLNEELIMDLAHSMGLPEENIHNKKIVLQILCMPCDQAIIDDAWSKECLPVLLGLAIEWAPQFIKEQVNVGFLCEELRTIGEDSKFEILKLLQNESGYGQEIARKLNLDAATVSRHLTALTRYGLIYVERKEKRNIYYKLNQNEIRNLLESLQRIFLE